MESYQERSPEHVSRLAKLLGQIVEAELLFVRVGEVAIPVNLPESSRFRLSVRDRFELWMLRGVPFTDNAPDE